MRLTYKLTLALLLGMSVILAANAWVRVQREVALFESDMKRDASLMGRTLAGLVRQLWRTEGEERVVHLLEETSRGDPDVNIRWVWADAPPGSHDAPATPAIAGLPRGGPQMIVHTGHHEDALFTYVAVPVGEHRTGAIEVRESFAVEREYLRRTVMNVAVATGAIFLLSAIVAVVAGVRVVGRPMQQLVTMARRVGAGDLTVRAGLVQRDEIGELAREMDAMVERLADAFARVERETAGRIAALEQLRHADRLATVGQLASGLAHELGTPLNVVSGRAKLIASGELSPEEAAENGAIIAEQAARMTAIIRQLLDFARRRDPRTEPLDLAVPARRTLDMLSQLADKAGVALELSVPEPVIAQVDATQVQQVLTNLVVNGVQAQPQGGVVRLRVERARARPPLGGEEKDMACVVVEDEGVGIPPEDLPRLFEPFFTTKGVGEGTGLELSVAHGIVAEHGGWIDVSSEPGRGSAFKVLLPLAGGPAGAATTEEAR